MAVVHQPNYVQGWACRQPPVCMVDAASTRS